MNLYMYILKHMHTQVGSASLARALREAEDSALECLSTELVLALELHEAENRLERLEIELRGYR